MGKAARWSQRAAGVSVVIKSLYRFTEVGTALFLMPFQLWSKTNQLWTFRQKAIFRVIL